MTLSADLRRWALFAVWEDEAALDAFLADSPVPARWTALAAERYDVRLEPAARPRALVGPRALPGPAAAGRGRRTRGDPHPRDDPPTRLRAFYGAIMPPAVALHDQPGRLASVGVGEWPLARQATFSLWRSWEDVRAYAYRSEAHREVIRRTRAEDWYSEELFARFRPVGAAGTWNGADPLAASRPDPRPRQPAPA
jgi:hypothetical protein